MRRTGVAINTAMLAATIGINAGIEADIGAVVEGDQRFGTVGIELSVGGGSVTAILWRLGHPLDRFETVFRIGRRTAAAQRRRRIHGLTH